MAGSGPMLLRPSGVGRNVTFLRWLATLGLLTGVCGCAPAAAPGPAAPSAGHADGQPSPSSDPARAGRASLFVVHDVTDFPAFQKYFEDGAAERAKVGI